MLGVSRAFREDCSAKLSRPLPCLRKYLWHEPRASGRTRAVGDMRAIEAMHGSAARPAFNSVQTEHDFCAASAATFSAADSLSAAREYLWHEARAIGRQRQRECGAVTDRGDECQRAHLLSTRSAFARCYGGTSPDRFVASALRASPQLSASRKYLWHDPRANSRMWTLQLD